MQKFENKVSAQINLIKLPTNTRYQFELDEHVDWVGEILRELNEKAPDEGPESYLEETYLHVKGEIEKKHQPHMGEFLLIKGTIQALYAAECVRTLKPMKIQLDIPFKICFVDETLVKTELFEDSDETYVENDVYELYFYNKRTVNFQEMLHEQVFLNYENYPILDAESKIEGLS